MTVVAGAMGSNGHVYLACDSRITLDKQEHDGGFVKVWTDPERGYVFGGAGDLRAIQVIQAFTEWPLHRPNEQPDVTLFAVREMVTAIRAGAENQGVIKSDSGVEEMDFALIVGWKDNLIVIDGGMSVTTAIHGRAAIGSGSSEAYGALGDKGPWTPGKVTNAVKRACITASGVGGPVLTVSTTDYEVRRTR